MPVHHFGKEAGTGLRGASAFSGGADAILACKAGIDPQTGVDTSDRTLSVTKLRGGQPGPLATYSVMSTVIGYDEDREPETAPYVEFGDLEAGSADKGKSKPLPLGLQVVIAAINEALNKHGEHRKIFEEAPPRKAVRIDHVRDEFLRGYVTGDSSTTHASKVRAFSRNLAKVLEGRKYASRAVADVEYLWMV